MDDKSLQVQIVEARKMNSRITAVLKVIENGMVCDDKEQEGNLEFPLLIGNENSAADESEKMHLEQAVHLVDVLRHKKGQYRAEHILVEIGSGEKRLHRIIGDKRQPADSKGDGPRIEIRRQQQPDDEEPRQKIIHEPAPASFHFSPHTLRLRLQVTGRIGYYIRGLRHLLQVGNSQP